jgi:hypothetical protein
MKYKIMVELEIEDDEIIGAKEQIAAALENIGTVKITEVE